MKLKISQHFELEEIATTGIGLVDALITICHCNSDVAAGAHDPDVQASYERGRAKGVAALMTVLEREGSRGNVSAINALMRAGKVATDLDQAAIEIRRKKNVRVIDVGASVRAAMVEQHRLIEENWPPPTRLEIKLANGVIQPLGAWENE